MDGVFDKNVIAKGFIEPRRKKQDSILEEQISNDRKMYESFISMGI